MLLNKESRKQGLYTPDAIRQITAKPYKAGISDEYRFAFEQHTKRNTLNITKG